MDILPILAALRRHRTATILIALEIALSCAILCNAIFMIATRLSWVDIPSGLAEDQVVTLQITGWAGDDDADIAALAETQLAALRAVPDVQSAAAISTLPLSNDNWQFGVSLTPDADDAIAVVSEYIGGQDVVKTLGLKLVAGRDFMADDYQDIKAYLTTGPSVITTTALANKLWPGENALGKAFYIGDRRYEVIGIVEHQARAQLNDVGSADYTALFPAKPGPDLAGSYILRTTPEARERVLKDAVDALQKLFPSAIVRQQQTFSDIRDDYFKQDQVMARMLIGVCVLLLIVTALGIVGLASFWVQQRRRQIGIRRALGATRANILQYFQIENFLIVSGGIALGMAGAYGLNLGLMHWYELPRMPWLYLPVGAIALWLIGQIAVLGPALRAAAVPPVIATRSV